MQEEKTKGFSHVVVTSSLRDGFSLLVQAAGLGGMKHNTVLLAWPAGWRGAPDYCWKNFIGTNTTKTSSTNSNATTGGGPRLLLEELHR